MYWSYHAFEVIERQIRRYTRISLRQTSTVDVDFFFTVKKILHSRSNLMCLYQVMYEGMSINDRNFINNNFIKKLAEIVCALFFLHISRASQHTWYTCPQGWECNLEQSIFVWSKPTLHRLRYLVVIHIILTSQLFFHRFNQVKIWWRQVRSVRCMF